MGKILGQIAYVVRNEYPKCVCVCMCVFPLHCDSGGKLALFLYFCTDNTKRVLTVQLDYLQFFGIGQLLWVKNLYRG